MKNWTLTPLWALLLLILPFANCIEAADLEGSLELSNGYRLDDFDWNIAGNTLGTNLNVFSEVTWLDLWDPLLILAGSTCRFHYSL